MKKRILALATVSVLLVTAFAACKKEDKNDIPEATPTTAVSEGNTDDSSDDKDLTVDKNDTIIETIAFGGDFARDKGSLSFYIADGGWKVTGYHYGDDMAAGPIVLNGATTMGTDGPVFLYSDEENEVSFTFAAKSLTVVVTKGTAYKAFEGTFDRMEQTAPAPEQPDPLTLSEAQTEQALQQLDWEQRQLHQRLGQYEGQMEALGDRGAIEQELTQVQERLGKLENYNAALTMALETLNQATTELQRRFAPRISARARELFGKLTGGRYDRLLLSSDFSMEVAATDEDIPHGVLWRSDGTADGLYLALRLAVAEELTPEAPLVLDDAFVRFDDKRLKAAMEILKEYAEEKQVILFTCQTREKEWQHEQS